MLPLPYNAPPGFDWVVKLERWQLERNRLHITSGTAAGRQARLIFAAVSPSVWRMTFLPPGVDSALPTPIVVGNREPSIPLTVAETPQHILVSGPHLTLQITTEP